MRTAVATAGIVAILLSACGDREQATTAKEPPNPRQKPGVDRAVALYFETADLTLAAEERVLTIPSTPAQAIETLVNGLIEGPRSPQLHPVFPAGVTLRAAFFLPQSTAVIDLSGEPLQRGWPGGAHGEWMAMQAVAHTLARNLEVRQVRFLVDGQPAPTLGGHVAIKWGIRPASTLVAQRVQQPQAPQTPAGQ